MEGSYEYTDMFRLTSVKKTFSARLDPFCTRKTNEVAL